MSKRTLLKCSEKQNTIDENRAIRSIRQSIGWRNQRTASVNSRRNISFDGDSSDEDVEICAANKTCTNEQKVAESIATGPLKEIMANKIPNESHSKQIEKQKKLQERLKKFREERDIKQKVAAREKPSKPFVFRHAEKELISFNKPLAPLPAIKTSNDQSQMIKGTLRSSSSTASNTYVNVSSAVAKPHTSNVKTAKLPEVRLSKAQQINYEKPGGAKFAKSCDKNVPNDYEPSHRVTRSQAMASLQQTHVKTSQLTNKCAMVPVKEKVKPKVVEAINNKGMLKMDNPSLTLKANSSSKTKNTSSKLSGTKQKTKVVSVTNSYEASRPHTRSNCTPSKENVDERRESIKIVDSPLVPVDDIRVNCTRGHTSFAPHDFQFKPPEGLQSSEFVYRRPDNLLSMSFKPMSPASIKQFFGSLDDSSSSTSRVLTPKLSFCQPANFLTRSTVPSDNAMKEITLDDKANIQNVTETQSLMELDGDVVQLAGDVRRLQLLSSTNASTSDTFLSPHYLSSNEKLSSESETFLTPPAVRSAVSDVKSSQRSHRRSVSSVPFRLRNTPKLLQNSLILQSLSPEQCVEILRNSPMIEMTRRRSTRVSSITQFNENVQTATESEEKAEIAPTNVSCDVNLNINISEENKKVVSECEEISVAASTVLGDHNTRLEENVCVDMTEDNSSSDVLAGTVPYYRKLINDETGRLMALCCRWARINEETCNLPDKVRGEIRSFIGQAELLMAQRFKQFSSLIDNCEFGLGEKITTCTDLQGFWDMIYYQVEDVNKKFAKLDMMRESDWQYSTPVLVSKTKKVTKSFPVKKVVAAKPTVSRFAAFRAAQKAPAEHNILEEPSNCISKTIPTCEAATACETMISVVNEETSNSLISQDMVKLNDNSEFTSLIPELSIKNEEKLTINAQTPSRFKHKRVSELLYSPLTEISNNSPSKLTSSAAEDLMSFTPPSNDKKSIVKDTFLESLSHSTNPHVTRSSRKLSSNHSFLREADFENLTHSITPQVTRSCRRSERRSVFKSNIIE